MIRYSGFKRGDLVCFERDARELWLDRFHRIVLTRRPAARWSLDTAMIDHLYAKRLDPVVAAHRYLDLR